MRSSLIWLGTLPMGILSLVQVGSAAEAIRLSVTEPSGMSRADWPVTSGVPFARGVLREADSLLLTEADSDERLPFQTRVTCRWPDGSVKWILLDTQVSLKPKETKGLTLHSGSGASISAATRPGDAVIMWKEVGRGVCVDTGPLQTTIRSGGNLPGAIRLDLNDDGRCVEDEQITGRPWSLVLETADGRLYRSDALPAEVRVEEAGMLRTAVRIEGQLADAQGTTRFRYLVRLHFHAGKPFVRAFVTLIVDVPDQVMVDIRSFKLILPADEAGDWRAVFGAEEGGGAGGELSGGGQSHRLFQVDDTKYQVDGKDAGKRAAGWASRGGPRHRVSAGVRHFWQQWPKAIAATSQELSIELIPAFEKGLYDGFKPADESKWTYALRDGKTRLKQGVAKTHEVWIFYGKPDSPMEETVRLFTQAFEPLLATCEPGYICATKALGDFPPSDPDRPDGFMGYDRSVAQMFQDHMAGREKTREYGLLNWGDWWGERGYNWGNLEYDMQRGLIAQYARTGKREYYFRAEEAARHHIDVDVVHAVNSELKHRHGPGPAVGDVWVHATGHTGGYFPDAAFNLEWPYTMGYSRNLGHVWDRGDLDYYFLSGDERAREVALRIAERLRVGAAPSFKIGTHMRDIGWPMMAMMAAYRATGETKYLEAVRHGWEVLKEGEDPTGGWTIRLAKGHCLHEPTQCKGNVDFIMGIVISSLCDYHRETGDPEVARTIVRAVDFTLRETYQPDKKMFRYTSCPLTGASAERISLMSEGLAYAWRLSGDEKYLRVLHDAWEVFRQSLAKSGVGKSFSMHLIFSPEGLWGIEPSAHR
ncbi:MAG TPA: hypothetical protein VLM89_12635 [Phycisphaerae bacterium]|nr:hypothetical protein [Phycisphaerae bacterium]